MSEKSTSRKMQCIFEFSIGAACSFVAVWHQEQKSINKAGYLDKVLEVFGNQW